jgi:hypothetical protein
VVKNKKYLYGPRQKDSGKDDCISQDKAFEVILASVEPQTVLEDCNATCILVQRFPTDLLEHEFSASTSKF